ncbi:MAG: mechanosensitive ion channel [Acidobacteriota bacterium]|nr:mechanosensitive ion channel [Acidobacteriota bacterium]
MATTQMAPEPESSKSMKTISRARLILLLALAALFLVCIASIWVTRDVMSSLAFMRSGTGENANLEGRKTIVDLSPWKTAAALLPLAVTAEEKQYARDAARLADHDVDQAFAAALRQASLNAAHRKLVGEALALSQRVEKLREMVSDDKSLVDLITASKAEAGATSRFDENDLDVAKTQLGLDSDQLADAQSDFNRAVGDNRSDIQAELAAHEAVMRKYDADTGSLGEVAVLSAKSNGTLAGRIGAWLRQDTRINLLQQAQQSTNRDIARLTIQHNQLEPVASAAQAAIASLSDRAGILAAMQDQRTRRQILSILDDRIQTETQLASVYEKWAAQVQLQHRIVLHLILQSVAVVLLILILTVLADTLIRRIMSRPSIDRRQKHTLRAILELATQVVGGVLILLVIFGAPEQTPTILGLVTAGITIVLQDFILAFFGWFFLMGKNGMRLGDWVEINGVGGEVVEIGLIYTTLLETGKLGDKDQPTGRRIAFINSFAIRGQYFNFTTSGQWTWDEITVAVPASADPRVFLDKIQKAVVEETQTDVRIAEVEWTRAMRRDSSVQFSAAPMVTLRPTAAGTEIQVRYIARASGRFEVRNRINQRVVDILREPPVAA